MKTLTKLFALGAIALCSIVPASAEQLIEASTLRIANRGWSTGRNTYGRIPLEHIAKFNSTAQSNADCGAGVAVRFATNSRSIGVKYTLKNNTHMNHQAATGTKGMCLYILDDGKWRYVYTHRPADQRAQEGNLVENLDGAMHEYMLYLPTYDGVTEMYVKIDDAATISAGNYDAIDATKRVVAYGTSILQGGCASRPGTCPTAIISRDLNCEVINLAFSGGGKMEITAAQALATIENPCAFIVDPVPNCDDAMCRDLTYDFVKTLRDAHPGVPVIMVEGQIYPYARYNSYFKSYLPKKNDEFRKNYEKLYAEDPTNLFLVTAEQLDPAMEEGTVEGIHMTDVGFFEYAKVLEPILEPFARGRELMAVTSPATGAESVSLTPTITWSDAEREGRVEISTSATFAATQEVWTGTGKGYVEVPRYTLAAGTLYYARVAYMSGPTECYTEPVQFTTELMTPAVPVFAHPLADGTLHANETFAFEPVEGASGLRLEVSASNTFPSRTSYISGSISTKTWKDGRTGAEIKLGSSALEDGKQYFARVRASYGTGTGTANTEYSSTITFTYSASAGVNDPTVTPEAIDEQHFDIAGRRVDAASPSAVLTRRTLSTGQTVVSKGK